MNRREAARPGRPSRVRPIVVWAYVGLLVGAAYVLWPVANRPSGVDGLNLWFALGFPAAVGAVIGWQLGQTSQRPTPRELWHGALCGGGGVALGATLGALFEVNAHPRDPAQVWQLAVLGAFFGAHSEA